MTDNATHAAELLALKEQVIKVRAEQTKKFKDLEDAIANIPTGTTPEVDAAMAALKTEIQVSDDDVPDAPPVV